LVIIFILVTLSVPAFEQVRVRVEKVNCMGNLRQLYTGANSYAQDKGQWPQVNPSVYKQNNGAYDNAWIEDLMPYGIGRATWICPTIQRQLGGPDYTQTDNYRTDYIAMPFDSKHLTPYKWPEYPWFVERGNVHGNGNLMIEANGSVTELTQMQTAGGSTSGAPPVPSH